MMIGSKEISQSDDWILGLPNTNSINDDIWIKMEPQEPSLNSPTSLKSPTLTSPTLTSQSLTSPTLTSQSLTSPTLTSLTSLNSPILTSQSLTSPTLTCQSPHSPTTLTCQSPNSPTLTSLSINSPTTMTCQSPHSPTTLTCQSLTSPTSFSQSPVKYQSQPSPYSCQSLLPITLPTPPHSPPTEHDLDDLVASIPEILESPSASPSDISDILLDLEGMETSWLDPWWTPPPPVPALAESLKKDIMWGGGCCDVIPKKERTTSESSTDLVLRHTLRQDYSDDDDDDAMPDTPSGTDTEGDEPKDAAPQHYYTIGKSTVLLQPQVNREHNYCGRPLAESTRSLHTLTPVVPSVPAASPKGLPTPSDTEDEVDVVSYSEQIENRIPLNNTNNSGTTSNTVSPTMPSQTKKSAEVKRQLQLVLQEAMRNRQNKGTWNADEEAGPSGSGRLLSVKIKTQGKPAAYTKRMRDQHSEQVIRGSKHRRRGGRGGESDEGRRSVHNSLERQRRVDLRNAFEYLRCLVPETKILEKAPKVQILKKAADHCNTLRAEEERMVREKEMLVRRIDELKRRKALSS